MELVSATAPQYGLGYRADMTSNPDQSSTAPTVLEIETSGHTATVFLNRPEKRNALGEAFFAELPQVMAGLGADPDVRVVVIAARGPAFTVGLDLTSFAGLAGGAPNAAGGTGGDSGGLRGVSRSAAAGAARIRRDVLRLQDSISSISECPKPVIAAVHGYCIGGGIDLISACDMRVASADAVFSVRETRMAMVADLGTLARLPLVLSLGHVAELAYTGKDIDAVRAEHIGLVNSVHADQDATLRAATVLAAEIAANSPLAVEGTKAVLSEIHRGQVESSLRYVAAWNAGHLLSDDLTEAVTAFFERRDPRFTGN
jgi:enoyl-CoA hydratase